MKPVVQRVVCRDRGDCLTAAIASILELEYERVPTWAADAHDQNASPEGSIYRECPHANMLQWLQDRGYHYLTINWKHLNDWRGLVGAQCIATMPSQRFSGVSHAVVGTWVKDGPAHRFVVTHDPNPGNAPYEPSVEPQMVSFLVPLDPSAK